MSVFNCNDLFAEFNEATNEEEEGGVDGDWEELERCKKENAMLKLENILS